MRMNGPGKYDDECAILLRECKAVGVLLMVVGGDKGHGVSFKMLDPSLMLVLPDMLRAIADQVERDAASDANTP